MGDLEIEVFNCKESMPPRIANKLEEISQRAFLDPDASKRLSARRKLDTFFSQWNFYIKAGMASGEGRLYLKLATKEGGVALVYVGDIPAEYKGATPELYTF